MRCSRGGSCSFSTTAFGIQSSLGPRNTLSEERFAYRQSLTSSIRLLPNRLTWIDETNRGDHYYLAPEDRCLFYGEYFRGLSYRGGPTNQLIFNFKTAPSVVASNPYRARYKNRAVAEIAAVLRRTVPNEDAQSVTWVPIPPSKAVGHPDYDDRLMRVLQKAFGGYDADIRPLLVQGTSTTADHDTSVRLTPEELTGVLSVDMALVDQSPVQNQIILFDDVLNTGKHFKCCQSRIREVLPDIEIIGIFVARCINPAANDVFEDVCPDHQKEH